MLVGTMLALALTFYEGDIKYYCRRVEQGVSFADLPPPSGYHFHTGGPFDSHLSQVTDEGPLEALRGWQVAEVACVAHLTADNCSSLAQARETGHQLAQLIVQGSVLPFPPRRTTSVMDAGDGVFSFANADGVRGQHHYNFGFLPDEDPRSQLVNQFSTALATCTKSMGRAHYRAYRHFNTPAGS